ncbi:MAG: hypothetical protein JXA54_01750 [Candidatus Heimdallarchaeota archaeon]|nr:hypothetical protein [Candidatus Heimdallarchaeota archaeon]
MARQFYDLACELRLEFNIKIQGKDYYCDLDEIKQDNDMIDITIESWNMKFERKENTKEYHIKEIERSYDYMLELKWRDIALLNTIILMTNGEILWVAIDEGWYGYIYKIEKGTIEVKEFPFYEVLKEGIIWGEKFKDVEEVKQHYYQKEEYA